ncbi:NADH:ubiquinone oxidoreductase intermediate-associated protein 30,Galactose-binding domain-like [Cinara cedri]|uniref:NADH:ubiquinone oxidoreductase intermediate-associated protein 30,Galactose-binding domain-like n=1 Tax=Cinara cedri TaxID=506608 RepID=A0A5E4NN05_9HEMI|nr:NADH:ubiquinone oxidoreductase intermediate-associated protein 30,Galactose-binding domain-like [Cinara cedri]
MLNNIPMKRFVFIVFFIFVIIQTSCSTNMAQKSTDASNLSLFDFESSTDLNNWSELSDTVRSAGRSKATFDLYKTQSKQSAVLFTWLNPLPNGACFAGVRAVGTRLNLDGYHYISFSCRSAGNATTYKIILRHNGQNDEPHPSFEQKFKVDHNLKTFVKMPLLQFLPYYRGKEVIDGPTLNVKNITSFGIQVAGGVYENFKQSGLSSLVLDRICAESNNR